MSMLILLEFSEKSMLKIKSIHLLYSKTQTLSSVLQCVRDEAHARGMFSMSNLLPQSDSVCK